MLESVAVRRIASVGLLASACLFARGAPAQESPDASVQADAKARLQQGVKAYSQGRYKDAVELFLVANRLVPSPALSFNIAKAYEKLRDSAAALNWYRDYLRRAPVAPDEAEVAKLIRKYELALRERGVQQVTVLSAPPGATVVIDGEPVGVSPWTGEMPPGKHSLTAELRGYVDAVKQFQLSPDRAMDVSVALDKEGTSVEQTAPPEPVASPIRAAEPEPTPADAARNGTAAGGGIGAPTWIAFGLGAGALGAAVGFELSRRSAEADARDAPTQVAARDAFDDMERRQTTARILAGAGGALLLVGGILLYVDLSRSGSAGAAGAQVGAACARPGCQLTLRGSL
jgi:tetratricopeptide (TPR) repeat protein